MINRESHHIKEAAEREMRDVHRQSRAAARHPMSRHPGRQADASKDGDNRLLFNRFTNDTQEIPQELPYGDFREVEWIEANLNGADAHGADFSAATLTDFCALGANLADIQLEEAQLQNAAICGTNLTNANLRHADLRNANLAWSDCRGAILFAADLRGANLGWADLRNVDLRQANLSGAYYNYQTQWPTGFDPEQAQMICLPASR